MSFHFSQYIYSAFVKSKCNIFFSFSFPLSLALYLRFYENIRNLKPSVRSLRDSKVFIQENLYTLFGYDDDKRRAEKKSIQSKR